jgi:hypothetical protein
MSVASRCFRPDLPVLPQCSRVNGCDQAYGGESAQRDQQHVQQEQCAEWGADHVDSEGVQRVIKRTRPQQQRDQAAPPSGPDSTKQNRHPNEQVERVVAEESRYQNACCRWRRPECAGRVAVPARPSREPAQRPR